MMDNETMEEGAFCRFIEALYDALKMARIGQPLNLRDRAAIPAPNTTTSDGWRKKIGSLGKGVVIELRWDKFTGYPDRKLWYGVYSKAEEEIRNISRIAQDPNEEPLELNRPPVITVKGWTRLKKPLAPSLFGEDMAEYYPGEDFPFFYGVYSAQCKAARELRTPLVVGEAVKFYSDLTTILRAKPEDRKSITGRLEAKEKLLKARLHESWETTNRNSRLAIQCKQRDGYRCKVCRMKFDEFYGGIGYQFAECHHTVPLAKLDANHVTTLGQLITVCANCHRMLHRMDGISADAARLAEIVSSLKSVT